MINRKATYKQEGTEPHCRWCGKADRAVKDHCPPDDPLPSLCCDCNGILREYHRTADRALEYFAQQWVDNNRSATLHDVVCLMQELQFMDPFRSHDLVRKFLAEACNDCEEE